MTLAEHDDDHRTQLLLRIERMRRARWTRAEIAASVSAWPSDWQQLVAGRV